jgi:hypothetical protein
VFVDADEPWLAGLGEWTSKTGSLNFLSVRKDETGAGENVSFGRDRVDGF